MNIWLETIKNIADDNDSFIYEKGMLIFQRHGTEYELNVKEITGCGFCVKYNNEFINISVYIQQYLLELNNLSKQIIKYIENKTNFKKYKFIDAPIISCNEKGEPTTNISSINYMTDLFRESIPDCTTIIQLMGVAGFGKTFMIEKLALKFAKEYMPDEKPLPIILPVDLLGRYVGTIDDAIAGTLNNTFLFPKLSQKDIVESIKNRWIILILDGFDELVARVGFRDAFTKINELLEQLGSSGTLLLSARETYFELYNVANGFKTYIQPRKSSYCVQNAKLSEWNDNNILDMLSNMNSLDPSSDYDKLKIIFNNNIFLKHPFYLTKIAELFLNGEEFSDVKINDESSKIRFVVDAIIRREVDEKWIDKNGNKLFNKEVHYHLLGGIASEMWATNSMLFDSEEIIYSSLIGVSFLNFTDEQNEIIKSKIPMHAVLEVKNKSYKFIHENFMNYFLSYKIAKMIDDFQYNNLRNVLSAKLLPNEVISIIIDNITLDNTGINKFSSSKEHKNFEEMYLINIGNIIIKLINKRKYQLNTSIYNIIFSGNSLNNVIVSNIKFYNCKFIQSDFIDSTFKECEFKDCVWTNILINIKTSFENSLFENTIPSYIDNINGNGHYSPQSIKNYLHSMKCKVEIPVEEVDIVQIKDKYVGLVDSIIKKSLKSCDFTLEEIEEEYGKQSKKICKALIDCNLLKYVKKDCGGRNKTFVRFSVDKSEILKCVNEESNFADINKFWNIVRSMK